MIRRKFVGIFTAAFIGTAAWAGDIDAARAASKAVFDETTARLDMGGESLVYWNASQLGDWLADKLAKTAVIIEAAEPEAAEEKDSDTASLVEGLKAFERLVRSSGLCEVSGLGASSYLLADGLFHNRFVVGRIPVAEPGLLWQFLAGVGNANAVLSMLPADTALAFYSSPDLSMAWRTVTGELRKLGIEDLNEQLDELPKEMAEGGVELERLLAGLGEGVGLLITLSSEHQMFIPIGDKVVDIPRPAAALMVKVKDSYLFDLLAEKLPSTGIQEVDGGRKLSINLPLPLPLPFFPTIVQRGDWLVAASDPTLIDAVFTTVAKGGGLTSTTEFKAMSARLPENRSGFKFVSARLAETLEKVQVGAIPEGKGDLAAQLSREFSWSGGKGMMCVWGADDKGFAAAANAGINLVAATTMQPLAFPAIAAGMLLPALNSARERARRISCVSNLKQIGLALKMYSMDYRDKFPEADGAEGLRLLLNDDYLTDATIFVCPSSNLKPAATPAEFSEATLSYVYFGGFDEGAPAGTPLAMDKLGNHAKYVNVVYLDGSARGINGDFRDYESVLVHIGQTERLPQDIMDRLLEKARKLDQKPE